MDYSVTAKEILKTIGGEANILTVTHCMTRLRFVLKDEDAVNDDEIKAIIGVAGVMKKAGQYQIIIGNDVAKCYKEFMKLGNFSDSADERGTGDGDGEKGSGRRKKKQNIFMAVLDVITGCMSPIIPAIIGAGMIKVLIIILGFFVTADSETMKLLTVMGDCAFYFMPMLIAFSSGRKFGANPYMVAAVTGVLLHPDFIALLNSGGGAHFLGIPVTQASYSSTIIPVILTAWAMSHIERWVEKVTPSVTKNFLKPALILLISAPVAFIILGPLGSLIGNGLAAVIYSIQSKASIVAMILMSAAMPFIVMTGMHWAFVPMALMALDTPAGESILLPAMLASNLAQGAACVAVAMKSKNSSLKQVASASGFSALLAGITEPGMYGVTIPLKRPMAAACIAGGVTGAFIGFVRLTAHAFATPAIVSLPQFISPDRPSNIAFAAAAGVCSVVVSFVLTWVMGFEDPVEIKGEKSEKGQAENGKEVAGVTCVAVSESAQAGGASTVPGAAPMAATTAVPMAAATAAPMASTTAALTDTAAAIHMASQDSRGAGNTVYAPIAGKAIPLSQVNDPTFSMEILGKGLAVVPEEGKVYAPFDGKVVSIFDTKHALGLKSDSGLELLIHVGLETVRLNGEHFTAHVTNGQNIKKGDLMLEFDLEAIRDAGYETVTPVIVNNVADYTDIMSLTDRDVKALEPIIKAI